MSGICYLLMFRFSYFKAVWKAHKDFRQDRKAYTAAEIEEWLSTTPDIKERSVKGRYGKFIVWQSLLRGKHIFEHITELI